MFEPEKLTHSLSLQRGELKFPVFLPDATFGIVRSVDAQDLAVCQVQAVVMNTYHLMQKPGSSTIQALGGLNRMTGWDKPIITDSGGFQAYSLIHQNPKFGTITDQGIRFQPEGSDRKYQLTPAKCIQLQLSYGSDVVICLDDCTHVDAPQKDQELSVKRTIQWARRCKATFDTILDNRKVDRINRPKLFGVIQGGGIKELRARCAQSLLELGLDGFGYGGWPLDGQGHLLEDILTYTREQIPAQFPMHALGVGHPENVVACYKMGYGMFDSAMPTRDARHGRLYAFSSAPENRLSGEWFHYVYMDDKRNIKSDRPISDFCDCPVCQRYSMGFLNHLFKTGDTLITRLCTIHNLRFMTQLSEQLNLEPL
jgi:queuine tRNA-ribosyltransferase